MPAFQFPDPAVEQSVINPSTGSTYIWKASPGKWVVQSNRNSDQSDAISQLQSDVSDNTNDITDLKARPLPKDYMIGTDKNLTRIGTARSGPALELVDSEGYFSNVKFQGLGGLVVTSNESTIFYDATNVSGGSGDIDLDDYYTKDEIDDQFAMRGIGYNYLLSGITSVITIRPGEFTVDHRLAGQASLMSVAPEDDDGHEARTAVIGDIINLIDVATQIEYRYSVTSVATEGVYGVSYIDSEDKRDNAFSVGSVFIINIFPTHISAADYYTKTEANSKFLNKQGGFHNINSTVKYMGGMTEPQHLITKSYVDTAVGNLQVLLSAETAEPDMYYSDYAPTTDLQDGSMWFDSMNLRLNIYSQGAWVNPDRNDGVDLEDRMSALEVRIAHLEAN